MRIALFGTFDTPNFGDCLFPLIVRQQLERRLDNLELLPVSPTSRVPAIADYDRVYAFNDLCGAFDPHGSHADLVKKPLTHLSLSETERKTGTDGFFRRQFGEKTGLSLFFRDPAPTALGFSPPPHGASESYAPDAYIIGGGALLSTEHVLFSYPQIRLTYPYSLKCWLLPAMMARACNAPLILNGIGFGPFDPAFNALAAKYLAPADICGVRDSLTRDFLQSLGVSPEIIPDCGILTPELQSPREWAGRFQTLRGRFNLPQAYMAVQALLYLGAHLEPFASAVADAAKKAGLPVVLVPICHHLNDRVACRVMRRIFQRKGVNTTVIDAALTSLDTAALLSRAELFTGTSLHAALVTLAFGKPAVSFSLSHMTKNRAVLDAIGAADCYVNDPAMLPCKIQAALKVAPPALDQPRDAVGSFFDRARDVICSAKTRPGRTSHPPTSIEEDLAEVNRLSTACAKKLPLLRRCGAVLIRNNRLASEWYDRAAYWAAVRAGKP